MIRHILRNAWIFTSLVASLVACGRTEGPTIEGGGGTAGSSQSVDAGSSLGGSGGDSGARGDAGTTTPDPIGEGAPVDKIDLLFMIDNSRSMSDKHELLEAVVPDFVSRLVNPICVDASGQLFPPPALGGTCPSGQTRQFEPMDDINIGIVSSSLGDVGANVACPTQGFPLHIPDRVDLAHLVGSLCARAR